MRAYLDDILFWVGAGLVTLGCGLAYVPAGLVAAGLFFLVFSFLLGKAAAQPQGMPDHAADDEDNGA